MPKATTVIGNVALAAGVGAAVALAVLVSLPQHRDRGEAAAGHQVYVALPRFQPPDAPPGQSSTQSSRMAVAEPFDPPAPSSVEIAVAPRRGAGEQMAALTPPERTDSAPPLSSLGIAPRTNHVGQHRSLQMPNGTAAHQNATGDDEGGSDGKAPSGVRLAGHAIVTAALELNISGKPIRLFGIKPPGSGDICAPSADFAARSCPDVSRQVLAALIGVDGDVSCRILATGGRAAMPAVCTDSNGTDLATYLVTHGFALADPNDVVDYTAGETKAKSTHTGLWSYR